MSKLNDNQAFFVHKTVWPKKKQSKTALSLSGNYKTIR